MSDTNVVTNGTKAKKNGNGKANGAKPRGARGAAPEYPPTLETRRRIALNAISRITDRIAKHALSAISATTGATCRSPLDDLAEIVGNLEIIKHHLASAEAVVSPTDG